MNADHNNPQPESDPRPRFVPNGEIWMPRTTPARGWVCPQCKTIWAPHVDKCTECVETLLPFPLTR